MINDHHQRLNITTVLTTNSHLYNLKTPHYLCSWYKGTCIYLLLNLNIFNCMLCDRNRQAEQPKIEIKIEWSHLFFFFEFGKNEGRSDLCPNTYISSFQNMKVCWIISFEQLVENMTAMQTNLHDCNFHKPVH